MKRRCVCCKQQFRPDPYHPYQEYCFKVQCQRTRRTAWQKHKLATDADYRAAQVDAQAIWKSKNTGYWKRYRATHPAYVERNRALQKQRRKSKNHIAQPFQPDVAKMDVAPLQQSIVSGRYRLISLDKENVAKIDFAIVQLLILEPLAKTG